MESSARCSMSTELHYLCFPPSTLFRSRIRCFRWGWGGALHLLPLAIVCAALCSSSSPSRRFASLPLPESSSLTPKKPVVNALRAVKRSLNDPMKNLSNWNKGDPCNSNWTGVFCDKQKQPLEDSYLHLVKLELMNMNLSGKLSPYLGKFSHLKILNFMWNKIGGSIPEEIGNLKNLQFLFLCGNHLTGPLPETLGNLPQLTRLHVDGNNISGSLPKSFANLNNLSHLHLNNNSISGEIPRELSRLPSLLHFALDNNNLSGSLPTEFSEMPNLTLLQLDNNNFNGSEIPSSYGNMATLVKLSLRNCALQGAVPDLSRIANLSYIDLSLNQLSGSIPSEKLADSVTAIILSHNYLNGTIPTSFSSLPRLQKLALDGNLLSGYVPSSLWQSRRLNAEKLTLDFRKNKLTKIVGSSSVPANVTLLLEGNLLCSNESVAELYCRSLTPNDNTLDMIPRNDTNGCSSSTCSPPYECAPVVSSRSYCAAPLIFDHWLESPGFADFLPYQIEFEKYLASGLSLNVDQLNIISIAWQEGPRLKLHLKLFPAYENVSSNFHTFNTSEVQRLWVSFTEWKIPPNDTFGPYELHGFKILDPYKADPRSTSTSLCALIGVLVGAIAFAIVSSAAVSYLIMKMHLKKKIGTSKSHKSSRYPIEVEGVRRFTYEEMALATSQFSSSFEIGQGGYGKVYKGALSDGSIVAIKRAQEGSLQGIREFCTEIKILSRLHHRHLVSLVGYCDDKDEQMLVYEFVPNGTLRAHLSAKCKQPLSFATRLRIALGSARGILYLHSEADPPIFHRDVKATNILLDSKFSAKVADFGLSRLAPEPGIDGIVPTHVSTFIKGTPGYLDPEYFLTHNYTDKSDVYSLGVVFLELLTGRQPLSFGRNMVGEVYTAYECGNILSVVDERIGTYPHKCAERFGILALSCCQEETTARPTMEEVVRELEAIRHMAPELETSSTIDSSYSIPTEGDSIRLSSSVRKNPFDSCDVSGSDLVSGAIAEVDPR